MINRLGNLEPFIPDSPALGERAELSMACGEVGTGEHGGDQLTEALQTAIDHPGPYLLNVMVTPTENVYPMVPAGGAINEMVFAPESPVAV